MVAFRLQRDFPGITVSCSYQESSPETFSLMTRQLKVHNCKNYVDLHVTMNIDFGYLIAAVLEY